jgi:hypothetical protein
MECGFEAYEPMKRWMDEEFREQPWHGIARELMPEALFKARKSPLHPIIHNKSPQYLPPLDKGFIDAYSVFGMNNSGSMVPLEENNRWVFSLTLKGNMPNVTFLLGCSGYRYRASLTNVANTGMKVAKRRPPMLMKLRLALQASSTRSSQLPPSQKPVKPQVSFSPGNDPKPQTPPIKDPWGCKGKMFLEEDNIALNNEHGNTVGGHGSKRGLGDTSGLLRWHWRVPAYSDDMGGSP